MPQKNHSVKEHLFLTFLSSEEASFTTNKLLWNRKVLQMLKALYGAIYTKKLFCVIVKRLYY